MSSQKTTSRIRLFAQTRPSMAPANAISAPLCTGPAPVTGRENNARRQQHQRADAGDDQGQHHGEGVQPRSMASEIDAPIAGLWCGRCRPARPGSAAPPRLWSPPAAPQGRTTHRGRGFHSGARSTRPAGRRPEVRGQLKCAGGGSHAPIERPGAAGGSSGPPFARSGADERTSLPGVGRLEGSHPTERQTPVFARTTCARAGAIAANRTAVTGRHRFEPRRAS